MKHSIVLKFLAVFLCAASLLGAVAGGVGIIAMTETGLYDRSFEEAYDEYVQIFAESKAQAIGLRYASMELGGCNTQLADTYYSASPYPFDESRMGYAILDAQGNVVLEQKMDEYPAKYQYEYPVGGSYIKVLSEMTSEEYHRVNPPVLAEGTTIANGEYVVYSALPEEPVEVYRIELSYADGYSEAVDLPETGLGVIGVNELGQVEFIAHKPIPGTELGSDRILVRVAFLTVDGQRIYEANHPAMVLSSLEFEDGLTVMIMRGLEDMETEPEQADTVLYDAIPPEGIMVAGVHVVCADGFEESIGGTPDIGFLGYDENGNVVFTSSDMGLVTYPEVPVTYIAFHDGQDALVYEASDPDGVGAFHIEENKLVFRVEAESVAGGEIYIYDDVPPQGYAVYEAVLFLEGETDGYTVDRENVSIGHVSHDETGNIFFRCADWKDFMFSKPADVVYICLRDYDGRVLFECGTEGTMPGAGEVIGTFAYDKGGDLIFTLVPGEPAVAARTMEETLPPETTEVSVSEEATAAALETTEATVVPETTMEATTPMTTAPTEVTEAVEMAAETVFTVSAADEEIPPSEPYVPDQPHTFRYFDHQRGESMVVEFTYEEMPPYTVRIVLAEGAMGQDPVWMALEMAEPYKNQFPMLLAVSLLLFAVTAVYLCCAAGRKPGTTEVRAGGLNCISLELYAVIVGLGITALGWLGVRGVPHLLQNSLKSGLLAGVLLVYGMCLLVVGFCFACAAQFKTPGGYWWRNSLCARSVDLLGAVLGWLLKLCVRIAQVCERKLWPLMVRFVKALWKLVVFFWQLAGRGISWLLQKLKKAGDWLWGKLTRFFALLPVTWQWLLVGFVMFLLMAMVYATNGEEVLIVLCIGACIAIIIYGAHCFGTLMDATKRMSKGDLDEKVDDKLLIGSFREFAGELNSLADVAVIAAQKQLKSERMKTELITNVSHDIKTPLTSIINYVDLLQKPHSEEEQEQYLEVLDRQSQRLKKLIEDLMEMSKASTGNLAVDITVINAGEAINQALGEFADKLEKAQLTPVFRQPDDPIEMMADGRLVWRVMSNILGNAVKYALPGTRLYLDLAEVDGKVIISMKNISREELNVSADELLERFVRGDASRNTEGSGLGLNIAQSLMEIQKGQLQLLVDGDLFKVTLIFPGV